MKPLTYLYPGITLLIALFSCTHPAKEKWEKRWKEKDWDAIYEYTVQYRNSFYGRQAQKQIDAYIWDTVTKANTLQAYLFYYMNFPEGKNLPACKRYIIENQDKEEYNSIFFELNITSPGIITWHIGMTYPMTSQMAPEVKRRNIQMGTMSKDKIHYDIYRRNTDSTITLNYSDFIDTIMIVFQNNVNNPYWPEKMSQEISECNSSVRVSKGLLVLTLEDSLISTEQLLQQINTLRFLYEEKLDHKSLQLYGQTFHNLPFCTRIEVATRFSIHFCISYPDRSNPFSCVRGIYMDSFSPCKGIAKLQ